MATWQLAIDGNTIFKIDLQIMNPRAKNIYYKSPYKLLVTFTNGEVKEFDLKPYLKYPIYKELKNESFCRKAKIQNGIVVWNDEIDLDPDRLYLESTIIKNYFLTDSL